MAQTHSIYRSTAGRDEILALYDKVLAHWPVPSEHLRLQTRHGETFVIASGERAAQPLILLHGSGSNSATWAGDVVTYSRCCRVYAVDIPGEPGRSAPARFSCRGVAFREWLDDVYAGLELERAALVGMSLGAWAALDYALYRPAQVASLVLICPSGVCPPRLSFALAAACYMPLGDWGARRMMRLIFRGAPPSAEAARFFMLTARHFNYRLEAPAIFADDELRHVSMPVLFLAGEHDAVLQTRPTAERLSRLLPDLTVGIFGEDGHALVNMAGEALAFLCSHI